MSKDGFKLCTEDNKDWYCKIAGVLIVGTNGIIVRVRNKHIIPMEISIDEAYELGKVLIQTYEEHRLG